MGDPTEPKIPKVFLHIEKLEAFMESVGDEEAGKAMRAMALAAEAGNYAEVMKYPFVYLSRPEDEENEDEEDGDAKEGDA